MAEPAIRLRLAATPAGVRLCPEAEMRQAGARGFVLKIGEAYFHGFVVWTDGQVRGYADSCPHMGLPLEDPTRGYLTPDHSLIVCARHGALFDIASGACLGGPCAGARLRPWPVEVRDGSLWTA